MLSQRLAGRSDPVRVGLVGAGMFGSQVAYSVEGAPGMRLTAVADVAPEKATRALEKAGVQGEAIREFASAADADRWLQSGGRAVLGDGLELFDVDLDVVVEATGVPEVAARHAVTAITEAVDLVNVSVEMDAVVGPVLAKLAESAGVTYSMAYGDQPAKIVELYDWARLNGLEVVAAGRTTGDLNPHGTPDDALERHGWIGPFVDEYDPNPEVYNTFLDGTKVAVESCVVANALDLGLDTQGMHVPEVSVDDAPGVLCPEADGGVLERTGVVDCLNLTDDNFSGFVVTRTDNEHLRAYLDARPSVPTAADGTYHLSHVPFHNAQETAKSVARVALDGEPTGVVRTQRTEVVAAAKRDLEPGDELDGGGGHTVYGVLEDADTAAADGYVPLELLDGATVRTPIGTDALVTADDVDLDTDSVLYHLRQIQESLPD